MSKKHVDRDNWTPGDGEHHRPRARNSDPDSSQASQDAIEAVEGKSYEVRPGGRMHEALTKAWALFEQEGEFTARQLGGQLWKRASDLKTGKFICVLIPDGTWDKETQRHVDTLAVTKKGRAKLQEIGPWSE